MGLYRRMQLKFLIKAKIKFFYGILPHTTKKKNVKIGTKLDEMKSDEKKVATKRLKDKKA